MVSTRLPLTTGGALVPLVSAILLFSTLVAGDAVLYSYTNPVCNGTTPQGRTVPIGQCVTFGSGQYARVLCQNGGWTLSVYDSSICPSSSQLWSINGDSATQCRDKSGDTSYKVNCEAANTRTSIHTTTSWSKGDCTGTGNPGSIYTAGACMVSGTNTTRRWHCNEDGSKVYRATYSDNTCTTIDSVVEYRASSTATQGCYRSTSYMCKNAELGPSVPYEFPIENFYETTSFYNSTKLDSAKVCFLDAYPVIQTSRQVTKIGKCDASTSRGTSESIVCSAPGGYRASVTYNDLTCQSPIYAKVQSTGCSGGSMGRCLAAAQLNFQLPTQGYIDYDGNNCTADSEKSATFVVAGGCIRDGGDSFKMQCNTDAASGITSAVVTTYDDQLCSGTVKSTKTYVADGTMCVPNRYDSGNLRRKYQCGFQAAAAGYIPSDARNFDTTGDNSATVIGQSTFGLIAAILIGMIAASL